MKMSNRDRIIAELNNANREIQDRGALVIEPDGFQWVKADVMGKAFMEYYMGLCSAAHALGATQ